MESHGMCRFIIHFLLLFSFFTLSLLGSEEVTQPSKKLAYIVSDTKIPFWNIMSRGMSEKAKELGYNLKIYSVDNSAKQELQSVVEAINNRVSGIIISPTNSSACVTVLRLAKKANIPVVISDIGTDGGEYLSYVASDNRNGAYEIGKILGQKMQSRGWQDGRVGIIAIPQKRANGQARTAGFMQALDEAGIKSAAIRQQINFSYNETYEYTLELMREYPNIRALWLQGSNQYKAALEALEKLEKRDDVVLLTFDAEPEFLELIPQQTIIASAMQQPYLIGEKSVETLDRHLQGQSVIKDIELPVLAISSENIDQKLVIIKRNVLGIE
jgi:ribose transport system substrate-binding protein